LRILDLYKDYSITHATENNKHTRPGWVQVHCPFCRGSNDFHLGYNLSGNYFYCWKHGWGAPIPTLAKILNVSEKQAKDIIIDYGGTAHKKTKKEIPKTDKKPFKLPVGTGELEKRHRVYLEKRNFDPDKLLYQWQLKATGIIALLDNTDYKHRIVAPVRWDGEIVTFQARDITGKSLLKYLACPKDREIIHHKHILYGAQEFWGDTGIIVEGITDVWRFGPAAAATFGIEYTAKQLMVIKRSFKRVAVVFDGGEAQAKNKADQMVGELRVVGVDAFRVDIVGDPGGMAQDEADYLVKQIL